MKINVPKYFVNPFSVLLGSLLVSSVLGGCANSPSWLPSSGANYAQVEKAPEAGRVPGIQIVDVNDAVARRLATSQKQNLFSETFGGSAQPNYVIGAGDVVEVTLWEAPPASLFGGRPSSDPRMASAATSVTTFPEQMVSIDGTINIPFAGQILAGGKSPQKIEAEITRRLKNMANQPQVLVRVTRNNSSNVTVVGEVNTSTLMPLTARGERLLDALAAAGGLRQPVDKTTLQITRGNQVQALPLDTIIRDPKQNILLRPGDVVTSLHQPLSFSVLGAAGKNDEVNFEAKGISLAQALARSGGLQDSRADAQGVFIFRFEPIGALDWPSYPSTTSDGKVPVIYRVDLKDPATFFVAQNFPVRNKDVLYVSNAPAAELQKFLNILTSSIYAVRNIGSLAP